MRSHAKCGRLVVTIAALMMTSTLSLAAAPTIQTVPENADRPSNAEIVRALDTVRADPNLSAERTIKVLRWKDSGESTGSATPGWLAWVIDFFRWLEQSARVLVWGAVIALAGYLVVYVAGMLRARPGVERHTESLIAPTHVRDLDIRPESLPSNIGAAARALWDNGEHRASLALLYRGTLSRLAHVHGVPIRDSSTEGDCLALAASRVAQGKREYVSRLVHVWQRFGYGHEPVQEMTVHGLCDDFASVLDGPSPPGSLSPRGAA